MLLSIVFLQTSLVSAESTTTAVHTAPEAIGGRPFPIAQERPLFYGNFSTGTSNHKQHMEDWKWLLDSLIASRWPERLQGDNILQWFIKYVPLETLQSMTGKQARSVRTLLSRLDEFERHALFNRFTEEVLPEIVRTVPKLPMKLAKIYEVRLSEYDFAEERFQLLGIDERHVDIGAPTTILGWQPQIRLPLTDIPRTISVPADAAQKLAQTLDNAGRRGRYAYYAIFLSFDDLKLTTPRNTVEFTTSVDRIALYGDPELTRLITEYDVEPFRPAPPPPIDERVTAIKAITPTVGDELVQLVADLSGDAAFVENIIRAHRNFREVSELEREAYVKAEIERLAAIKADDVWLQGMVSLGEYDTTAEQFAIMGTQLNLGGGSSRDYSIRLSPQNPEALSALPVQTDEAAKVIWLRDSRGDSFALRARVKPSGARVLPDGKGEVQYEIVEFYVFLPTGAETLEVIAHVNR